MVWVSCFLRVAVLRFLENKSKYSVWVVRYTFVFCGKLLLHMACSKSISLYFSFPLVYQSKFRITICLGLRRASIEC